ncbi:ankyrin repeat-containing domain protein [Hypoxylon sp. FL1284]|nr:ankyrin repeat-containing domain protein [Hypoxylon sp. FL1284]
MSFGYGLGDCIAVLKLANDIRKQFVGAPDQFRSISNEVRSLAIVLQDVDVYAGERDLSNQQLASLNEVLSSCNNVLEKVQRTLDEYVELEPDSRTRNKQLVRTWKRLTWDPKEVDELRSRITANITLLGTFLGGISSQATYAIKKGVDRLNQRKDDKERSSILDWLTPIDEHFQQADISRRRQAGTGQWFLDSPEFNTWLQSEEQALFCPGIPGAGKTFMTSLVIDELSSRFRDNENIGIAYVYCNFQRAQEQKTEDLIRCLLKQLAQGWSPLPLLLEKLYEDHKTKRTRPSLDKLQQALQSVACLYSKVFILVDALDECQPSYRSSFLAEIFALQASSSVNIFATSRHIPDISKRFAGTMSLEIRARETDVERYLEENMGQLTAFDDWNEQLRDEITAGISDVVDGMFLLAQIYLYSLDDKTTPRAVKNTLAQLRERSSESSEDQRNVLDRAYEDAMERINEQKPGFRILANKALSWITNAKRPLTAEELQHALAVEVDSPGLDRDNLENIERLISVCAGLVVIKEESQTVELVHYTTQEYFERTQTRWFPNAQSEITKVCVSYLSYDTFGAGFCASKEELYNRLWLNPFYHYAAQNWGHHARETSLQDEPLILRFLGNKRKTTACSQAMMASKEYFADPTHQISLTTVWSELDGFGRTPLSWAAQRGHDNVVQELLAADGIKSWPRFKNSYWGGQRPMADRCGASPLWYAARNGNVLADAFYGTTPLWLLLEKGVNPETPSIVEGLTPLSIASWMGQTAIVKLLLLAEKGTSLMRAAWKGHAAVAELLLADDRVNPNYKDGKGWTPLLLATANHHDEVVELLLRQRRINPNAIHNNYEFTPLSLAIMQEMEKIVKLLLADVRVAVNLPGSKSGATPLMLAVEREHIHYTTLLLDTGRVDVNSRDEKGQTALLVAARYRCVAEMKLLLAVDGIDPNARSNVGHTPLSVVVGYGLLEIVRLLIDRGAGVNVRGYRGGTPLLYAARHNYEAVSELLLEHGADTELSDDEGWTPLMRAASRGDEAAVRLLLDKGADVGSLNGDGRTPLMWAVHYGHEHIVKILLEKGAEPGANRAQ